jgi:hypothetical protein
VKNPPTFQEEAHCWTRRYEQLREQVLAGDNSIATDRPGLAVLIREGMAAWMRAWHEPLSSSVAAAAPEAAALSTSLRESWQQEATRLLVNMTLSHLVILSPKAFNS